VACHRAAEALFAGPPPNEGDRRRGSSGQVLVVALLWLSCPAVADTVQPTARAAGGVVVRKRPSTDSERIGALAPGDSADLIETARGWRKVRLSNATTGFVSSAWTEVLEGKATPARSTPGTRTPTVTANAPSPILHAADAVDWWFVFKFNTRSSQHAAMEHNASVRLAARLRTTRRASASSSSMRAVKRQPFREVEDASEIRRPIP